MVAVFDGRFSYNGRGAKDEKLGRERKRESKRKRKARGRAMCCA